MGFPLILPFSPSVGPGGCSSVFGCLSGFRLSCTGRDLVDRELGRGTEAHLGLVLRPTLPVPAAICMFKILRGLRFVYVSQYVYYGDL